MKIFFKSSLNLPNIITLSRIPLLFIIVGFLYLPIKFGSTIAFFLFIITSLTDWLDGYLARKYNMVSNIGKLMDALIDKILLIGLFIVFLAKSIMPSWTVFFVLVIFCRELLITGLRMVAVSTGIVLEAESIGKHKTVYQIIVLGLFLLVSVLKKDWPTLLPVNFVNIFFYCVLIWFGFVTFVTTYSGVYYILKYKQLLLDAK